MKIPAFQFYPGDWRKDIAVQALDFQQRGIWIEVLCLMHESERRGFLMLNGLPISDHVMARLLSLDINDWLAAKESFLTYGVCSIDNETGAIYNRRMVRDEAVRADNTERQRSHYNRQKQANERAPEGEKPNNEPNKNLTATSHTSSSSSSSSERIEEITAKEPSGDGKTVVPFKPKINSDSAKPVKSVDPFSGDSLKYQIAQFLADFCYYAKTPDQRSCLSQAQVIAILKEANILIETVKIGSLPKLLTWKTWYETEDWRGQKRKTGDTVPVSRVRESWSQFAAVEQFAPVPLSSPKWRNPITGNALV